MEYLQIILSIAGTAVGLIITTLTFAIKFVQNAKARSVAENIIKIGNAVLPFIQKAETFTSYSGAEKKEYVMTQATKFAIENGIKIDAAAVSGKIEELVALTKTVNFKKNSEE